MTDWEALSWLLCGVLFLFTWAAISHKNDLIEALSDRVKRLESELGVPEPEDLE
jgi:hypothetical protein